MPREDLELCNDPRRVALQATLPKCNAKGILERVSEMAPGPWTTTMGFAVTAELLGPRGPALCTTGTQGGQGNTLEA
ncbi:hypothetical protein E2562_036554 [Oryza meyeriana var. granulata]|uniref:Uncharacterized protein n=1 Tax=Oryza meyeriana var. granulata TaxID=110450 RepID=A0A6G1CA57_9ORYZ|nr:hypothetical protein E2562_036554 [Oryza meyeriana var. granulata]